MTELNLEKLKSPFPEDAIEWRLAQCGKGRDGKIWGMCLAYIQARSVMDRLDEVVGPENWKVSYEVLADGILCKLAIFVRGEWIEKIDGAECTDIEPFKGGLSGALKRAASVWGIGRYLYQLESGFIQVVDKSPQAKYGKTKEGDPFYWIPPKLPSWALPKVESKTPAAVPAQAPSQEIQNEAAVKKVAKIGATEIHEIEAFVKDKSRPNQWSGAQVRQFMKYRFAKEKFSDLSLLEFRALMAEMRAKTVSEAMPSATDQELFPETGGTHLGSHS